MRLVIDDSWTDVFEPVRRRLFRSHRWAVEQAVAEAERAVAVYNASKWGLNAFSESLRQEVTSRGVRVVVVEPGVVATELMDHITHEGTKEMARGMAQQMRQLQPDDVAAAVVYAVTQPAHIAVNEVLVRPTDQQG